MELTIVDTIASALFVADIPEDHAVRLSWKNQITTCNDYNAEGKVIGSHYEIKHTDFIAYINEVAL